MEHPTRLPSEELLPALRAALPAWLASGLATECCGSGEATYATVDGTRLGLPGPVDLELYSAGGVLPLAAYAYAADGKAHASWRLRAEDGSESATLHVPEGMDRTAVRRGLAELFLGALAYPAG